MLYGVAKGLGARAVVEKFLGVWFCRWMLGFS